MGPDLPLVGRSHRYRSIVLVVDVRLSESVSTLLRRAMSERSSREELAAYEAGDDRALYGWSINGELTCVAGVSRERPNAELLHVATSPLHERRGYADALIRAVYSELALLKLVAETDDDAVEFYRRTGFRVESVTSVWPGSRYRCTLVR